MSRATEDAARAARYAHAEAMYRGGASLKSIGLALGVHYTYVWQILRARGVPTRPRGRPRSPAVDAAVAAVGRGVPVDEAAAAHGCSTWAIGHRRRRKARP